jgi:tRNA G18 (ribose-2'-O)-methylase SpoU
VSVTDWSGTCPSSSWRAADAATIELTGKAESLNVAAAAIALYELERRRGTSFVTPS